MVLKLGTPKQYIMATGVAVFFEKKLKKLKLRTYPSISLGKARAKPPEDVVRTESGFWKEKFPSFAEHAAQKRKWTKFIDIYIPDAQPFTGSS